MRRECVRKRAAHHRELVVRLFSPFWFQIQSVEIKCSLGVRWKWKEQHVVTHTRLGEGSFLFLFLLLCDQTSKSRACLFRSQLTSKYCIYEISINTVPH